MTSPTGQFFRDASGRLTFEIADLDAASYTVTCEEIVRKFDLRPESDLIVGLDEMFRDYSDGKHLIGMEWDSGQASSS